MEKLIIKIGASNDHFGAFAENVEGVYGAGDSPKEALDNLQEAIRLILESRPQDEIPELLLAPYELEVHYDVVSLLRHYGKIITMPALSRLTGINDKLLHQYTSGAKRPRPAQVQKIETALHQLGSELVSLRLS
ncbi:MAG: type II toxin-antitoxin system HicB family antitoxin [Porphyromonadaceae bacterium]|nr:type II toxin-antitoxin system HicB family antitoxin [Porphyromonadaceae bacterium]